MPKIAKRRRRDSGTARNLKKSAFGLITDIEKTENPTSGFQYFIYISCC